MIDRAVWAQDALIAKGMDASEFEVATSGFTTTVQGSTTLILDGDRKIDRSTNSVVETTGTVAPIGDTQAAFDSLTPAICTISPQGGQVNYVSNGRCQIQCTSPKGSGYGRRVCELVVQRETAVVQNIVRFNESNDPSSLRAHLISELYALVNGKSPSAATCDLFTAASYSDPFSATLNPNFVADASKFSFQSFSHASASACFFIGPRHAIYARHTTGNYATVTVRRKDGSFQTVHRLKSWDMLNDFEIAVFDADVTGIDYATLLPQTAFSKLNVAGWQLDLAGLSNLNIPMFSLRYNPGQAPFSVIDTPFRHFRLSSLAAVSTDTRAGYVIPGTSEQCQVAWWDLGPIPDPAAEAWKTPAYGGDSSSGVFMQINGSPVLVSTLYSANNGPWIPQLQPYLADVMNALAAQVGIAPSNYAPIWADLSMFPSYA